MTYEKAHEHLKEVFFAFPIGVDRALWNKLRPLSVVDHERLKAPWPKKWSKR